MAEMPIVTTALFQNINGETRKIHLETSAAQVITESGSSVETRLAAMSEAISGQTVTHVVADIAARDALTGMKTGDQCWVVDATADPTVESGAAKYIHESAESGWVKTAEAESMDVTLAWADIQGRPASAVADLDDAVSKKHEHANKDDVLDALSATDADKLAFRGKAVGGRYGAYVTLAPEDEGFADAVAALDLEDGAFFTVVAEG